MDLFVKEASMRAGSIYWPEILREHLDIYNRIDIALDTFPTMGLYYLRGPLDGRARCHACRRQAYVAGRDKSSSEYRTS